MLLDIYYTQLILRIIIVHERLFGRSLGYVELAQSGNKEKNSALLSVIFSKACG